MIQRNKGLPLPLRYALRTVAAAVVLLVVLAVLSHVVMPKNNQREFGQIDARANGVMGEREGSVDVLFLGDSEAFSSFSPLQLWGDRGITSYVSATAAQRLCYTRTLLARALKRQTPRVVVLETNCTFARFSMADAARRLLKDVFPVFEYHDRWKILTAEDFLSPVRYTWTDELKGFRLRRALEAKPADAQGYMEPTDELAPMADLNRAYLEQISQMCKNAGARLVLVSTPSTKNWNMARHNRIAQVADELDVDYIDLNTGSDKVEIDWQQDTYDAGDHLNLRGAQKVTHAIGSILADRYGVGDHRGDEAFSDWDEAHGRYVKRLSEL